MQKIGKGPLSVLLVFFRTSTIRISIGLYGHFYAKPHSGRHSQNRVKVAIIMPETIGKLKDLPTTAHKALSI
jgi:hypothetical protein